MLAAGMTVPEPGQRYTWAHGGHLSAYFSPQHTLPQFTPDSNQPHCSFKEVALGEMEVCVQIRLRDGSYYSRTYAKDTLVGIAKADAVRYSKAVTAGPKWQICLCMGSLRIDDEKPLGAYERLLHCPISMDMADIPETVGDPPGGRTRASAHPGLTGAHMPFGRVSIARHGEGRLALRRVEPGAYVLLQARLPAEVVWLVCSHLELPTSCCAANADVSSLMCAIRAAWNVPVERQRLVFGGEILDEHRSIDSVPGLDRVFKLWPSAAKGGA